MVVRLLLTNGFRTGLQDAEQLPCAQIPAILSQISLDQGTQVDQQLHYAQGITGMPPATHNSSVP
jgi:hypothetical protein